MSLDRNSVLVILVVAFLVVGGYVFMNINKNVQTVTAQGISETKTQPDSVAVIISIETENESAQAAKDANALISDKVLTELLKLGIDKKEITTQSYNIYPNYVWDGAKQREEGYKVSNILQVKTSNFDKVGGIVDAGVNSGGLIQYINFELSQEKENEVKADVLKKASEDAKAKATAIVSGAGGKIGKLVSVSTVDYYYRPYPVFDFAGKGADTANNEARSAAVNISPGDLTISAQVQAVYEIK